MSPKTSNMTWCKVTLIAFEWFFTRVSFHMFPKIACVNRWIVTFFAFVWFLSTVNFQMSPQTGCLNICRVTLVAFVCFFSRVSFYMFPQIACLNRWIVTFALVAFVTLQVSPQRRGPSRCKVALLAFVCLLLSSLLFLNIANNDSWRKTSIHSGSFLKLTRFDL